MNGTTSSGDDSRIQSFGSTNFEPPGGNFGSNEMEINSNKESPSGWPGRESIELKTGVFALFDRGDLCDVAQKR